MEKIRLLVADDHPTFREGLCRILHDEEDLECIAKASDGMEAVRMAQELQPDVAILDVSMPNLDGIAAARQIKSNCKDTAIIMISAFDYESYVLASLRAGAVGYILKTTPLAELISAIRLVHKGESVFDSRATGKLIHHLKQNNGESNNNIRSEVLQPRELEVLKLAARGMSNKEIAGKLGISERTVQTHFINIFRKLHVNSRTQAVLYALKGGWFTIDNLLESTN